jgi:hypothetical protein
LGMFTDSYSWWDSVVIFTKSATAAMFTSVQVNFGQPPLSSSSNSSLLSQNREYHLKTFDMFRASFLQAFCASPSVSVTDRPAFKWTFMATLHSFLTSMMCKENWLHKTSCNSYTVKDKQTKLNVWMDVGW